MVLVASCRREDTWGRCSFALPGVTGSVEVAVADSAAAKAPAIWFRSLSDKGALLLAEAPSKLLFLAQFTVAWSVLHSPLLFFCPSDLARLVDVHFPDEALLLHLR
jgi:hypothetical protein